VTVVWYFLIKLNRPELNGVLLQIVVKLQTIIIIVDLEQEVLVPLHAMIWDFIQLLLIQTEMLKDRS
jgi:hypothetical protein